MDKSCQCALSKPPRLPQLSTHRADSIFKTRRPFPELLPLSPNLRSPTGPPGMARSLFPPSRPPPLEYSPEQQKLWNQQFFSAKKTRRLSPPAEGSRGEALPLSTFVSPRLARPMPAPSRNLGEASQTRQEIESEMSRGGKAQRPAPVALSDRRKSPSCRSRRRVRKR